jgi:hypothetical protein
LKEFYVETEHKQDGGLGVANPLLATEAMTVIPHEDLLITTKLLPDGHEAKFRLPSNTSLLEVLEKGPKHLNVKLLPPEPAKPLDQLHDLKQDGQEGPTIEDLDQTLAVYLKDKGSTPHFGIKLVLAFRVNTRWAVAPKSDMSPREILALPAINLSYEQYTLYTPGSNDPLPLDTPIRLRRGEALEAQKDGKYGRGA